MKNYCNPVGVEKIRGFDRVGVIGSSHPRGFHEFFTFFDSFL